MPVIERIAAYARELTAIRHDRHQYPEIGFEEVRTSGIVAELLGSWGIDVHRDIGKISIVGFMAHILSMRHISTHMRHLMAYRFDSGAYMWLNGVYPQLDGA